MVVRKQSFISLKWKMFALMAIALTVVAIGISWATYLFQEKQLQRERAFQIERNSLELAAQIGRTKENLVNQLEYINFGVLQQADVTSLDHYISSVEAKSSRLMLITGMQSLSIVNAEGQLLISFGETATDMLSLISTHAIENEAPIITTSCTAVCNVYAAIPVLLDNQVVSISATSPLTEVIEKTKEASAWDVGIYQPSAKPDSDSWVDSIVSMTNYAQLIPLLKEAPSYFKPENGLPAIYKSNGSIYELVSTRVELADDSEAYWILLSDVTASYSEIKKNTLQLLFITWAALLICALWLARLAHPNLLGLSVIPKVMNSLAKHDFDSAHEQINANSSFFDKKYPDELTVLAETTAAMSSELERLDDEMEDRNLNLQISNNELAKQRDFVSGLLDNAQAVIVVQNSQGECRSINKFGRLLLGKTESQCIGLKFQQLFGSLTQESKSEIAHVSNGRRRLFRHETQILSSDGITTSLSWMHSSLLQQEDQNSVLSIGMDITEQKHVQHQLHWLAIHDPLTELLNRSGLQRKLQSSIQRAKAENTKLALIFIDIDHFKRVNDAFGHPIGDKLLSQVASSLSSILSPGDTLSRWGGDEFVLLFENLTDQYDALGKAQLCKNQISNVFLLEGKEVFISASIGVSIFPEFGDNMTSLVKNADVALFKAKQEGRNQIVLYSPEHDAEYEERISLDTDLRYALSRDELYLQYQPQICAKTHRVIGVEALIRWNHPVHGFISPDRFIPLAEESGQIIEIGDWVIEQACDRLNEWQDLLDPGFKISVNVAGPQIIDKAFYNRVETIVNNAGIDPNCLEFEITETFIMTQPEETVAKLSQLKELGITMAIDDFGTGYSSLSYLKSLPIDKLKIDKSFVCDIGQNTEDEKIAKAIVALGHSLNLKVIAEGVESVSQGEFLAVEGCDEFQGYYFSRPLTEVDCKNYLQERPQFDLKCGG